LVIWGVKVKLSATGLDRPLGFQEAEAPEFLVNRHMKVVRLSYMRGGCSNIILYVGVFIHSSVICHTTGPKPLPKRFLYLMRSKLSPSNESILFCPQGHPATSYVLFLVFVSLFL
jgi:hypothetical protein